VKLPRDISGVDLAKSLRRLGYVQTRQTGSHMRLTTQVNGEHHVTVPAHDPLKPGTLKSILDAIAEHAKLTRSDLLQQLDL
jgi:predicted RNA binding protein YcfA (HicA-like mRNA interferase family)